LLGAAQATARSPLAPPLLLGGNPRDNANRPSPQPPECRTAERTRMRALLTWQGLCPPSRGQQARGHWDRRLFITRPRARTAERTRMRALLTWQGLCPPSRGQQARGHWDRRLFITRPRAQLFPAPNVAPAIVVVLLVAKPGLASARAGSEQLGHGPPAACGCQCGQRRGPLRLRPRIASCGGVSCLVRRACACAPQCDTLRALRRWRHLQPRDDLEPGHPNVAGGRRVGRERFSAAASWNERLLPSAAAAAAGAEGSALKALDGPVRRDVYCIVAAEVDPYGII
jgi:hypothetical protein